MECSKRSSGHSVENGRKCCCWNGSNFKKSFMEIFYFWYISVNTFFFFCFISSFYASVTEDEVRTGIFEPSDADERTLCFIRDFEDPPVDITHEKAGKCMHYT